MKIGQNIKKIRELRGLKQEAMAEKLNMSQANYSKLENDDADMSFSRLTEIAQALEVDVVEIVSFDKKQFFNNSNSNINNINSPVSINDKKLLDELIKGKNETIESLQKQIALLEIMLQAKKQ